MAKIDVAACGQIIDQMTTRCVATAHASEPARVAVATDPNWDHLANSFALAGDAVMYATFGLALIVAIGAVGWFVYVRHRTRQEAKTEVAKVAPEEVRAYLDARLPSMVAEAIALLTSGQGQAPTGGVSAEEQASDLGGEPG